MRNWIACTLLFLVLFTPLTVLASGDLVQTGNITIEPGQRVIGDVVSLGGRIEVHGEVFGDVVSVGGRIVVHPGAIVHGEAVAVGGTVEVLPGGQVLGDQVGIGVGGISIPSFTNFFSFNLGWTIFNLFVRMLLALLAISLLPRHVANIATETSNFGRSLGLGLLTWIAVIPLTIVVAITLIGIPLALLLILALWAAFHLGFAAIAKRTGDAILANSSHHLLGIILGSLILGLLMAIPVVGWLIRLLIAMVGVGAVVSTRFGVNPKKTPEV